jgi:hypothetical protein
MGLLGVAARIPEPERKKISTPMAADEEGRI